jgi:hypothetical protein
MIKTKRIAAILCVASFLLLPGCQRQGEEVKSTNANKEIICSKLYQKDDSLIDALKFIDTPEDRMETSFVSKRGKLADQSQLAFANKLFSLRKSKDVDMFISLLSDGSKKQLDEHNNKRMVRHHIRKIRNGTFLYGEYDCKFFATFRELTQKDWDMLRKHVSFAETPAHVIHYWHFHRPNYMLIGSTFYLIEDEGSYKIVTQTLLHGEIPPPGGKQRTSGPKEYGIVAFEQIDDAYAKPNVWKYRWDIELSLDESENNTFEILKVTKVISGQDDIALDPNIAKQVLVKESMFEKYRYKELKFTFRIGASAPAVRFKKYGERLTGWIYGISIASFFKSDFMLFPGKNITGVKVNKQGKFVDSDLGFITFETAKEKVRYEHKVILRKKPIIPKADL